MSHPLRAAILAALCIFSLPAFAWTGPQVSFGNKNGRRVIKICDQGGGCTQSTPFFLALNSQATRIQQQQDWSYFMYQAQLHVNSVGAGHNGVVPMLEVNVRNTTDAFLDRLAWQLNQLSPRPYLYVRLDLRDAPPMPGLEPVKMANLEGKVVANPANNVGQQYGKGSNWAFNETWLAYEEGEITRVLNRLDSQYPGRVIGLQVNYENGGEWLYRPYGYNESEGRMLDWGAANMCGTGAYSGYCNLFPWTNDSGTQAGPIGRHYFYLNDYSTTTETGFCNWAQLPAPLRTGCRAANVAERNNAVPGQPLPGLGQARGVFLNPGETGSLRAASYNRFISSQKVNAIIRLLTRARQVSGGRILTSVFYGYQYSLGAGLPTSGQTALTELLESNAVDFVVSPYSYGYSRSLGDPTSPMGPADALRLSNKLWFDEDDTRTHMACLEFGPDGTCIKKESFQTVDSLWDSIRVLRRNVLTAGVHGRGSYFFDLLGNGWFGRPDMQGDSDSLWANLQAVFMAVDKLQLNAPNRFEAQVAVFTDDLSANYVAGLTPAGENTFAFSADIAGDLINQLSRLGTPVKQYLLSDLLKSNLDLSAIKLAVLANAWNVPPNVRQAINTKLKTPGRTVLFVYAAGYMSQDAAASVSNINSLVGINVVQGAGTPALSQRFDVRGQQVSGGPDYPLTPWFTISDAAATTLGTYTQAGGVSLARKVIAVPGGSYTSVYAAAPKLPLPVLRGLSEDAGVHHFSVMGDAVEAAGNMVIVHAGTTGYRTLSFPQVRPRIFETALWPVDSLLCSSCSSLTQLPFNAGDTRAFRWTSAPFGNFELISGTSTLEGWAVDFDMPDTPVEIHVYRGGPSGVGTFFTSFVASAPRPDLTSVYGITGNSGFRVTVGQCPSGTPLYAYAIDPQQQNGDGNGFIGARTCP